MIKIGIIDRDQNYREKIISFLTHPEPGEPAGEKLGMDIIFENDSFDIPLLTSVEVFPHIVLIDTAGQNKETLRSIRKTFPGADIVILSNNLETQAVLESFRNGAVSYVYKENAEEFLNFAILSTFKGGSFTSPDLHRSLIAHMHNSQSAFEQLTFREGQIARGLLAGLSYKLIADAHNISLDTVRVYVKRIYRKLNINSKGELVAQLSG